MISATWQGATIARAETTVEVEGNHYFAREAVASAHLADSATTSVCPWKGTARYYSIVVDGQTNRDAAWYYPDPKPGAAQIKDRIAFWKGVKVG